MILKTNEENIQFKKIRKPSKKKEKSKRKRIELSLEIKAKESQIKQEAITENQGLRNLATFAASNGLKGKRAHHLMEILCQRSVLWASYESIRSNLGNLTPGTQTETADAMSNERIERLLQLLKDDAYEPRPVRRIYIPKPGKSKKRLIGIPNFDDKLIQDSIRIILNILYEPEFSSINTNYGFRPMKGCIDAIMKIRDKTRGMTYVLEGDIEGAYDNVNFETAINILKQKIEDKKFLRLIKKMFHAGYVEVPKKELIQSEKGVPQGSIVSPTLFNIYAHEMDKDIVEHLDTKFREINRNEGRSDEKKKSILYERVRSRIRERNKSVRNILKERQYQELTDTEKEDVKSLNKNRKEAERKYRQMKSTAQRLTPLRYIYVRYADDWIIFTNWHKKGVEGIRMYVGDMLERRLKLRLSPEKTLITDITKEPAKFLGFTFKNMQKYMPVKQFQNKDGMTIKRRVIPDIHIGIDKERVISRFKQRNFITEEEKPKRNPLLQLLRPHEIVTKYSQIISSIYNYYYEAITNGGDLGRYHYYLYYSCIHTLAAKAKCSITQIIGKYGTNLHINYEDTQRNRTGLLEKVWKNAEMPSVKLLRGANERLRTIHDSQRKLKKSTTHNEEYHKLVEFLRINRIKTIHKTIVESIIDYRLNTRSQRQAVRICPLCQKNVENKRELESHHLAPLKKRKDKPYGFEAMLRNLNTLQVMVCKECHQSIHKGKWAELSYKEYERINEAIRDVQRE